MNNVDSPLDHHVQIYPTTFGDLVSEDGNLDYEKLKQLVISLGADDAGFVDVDATSMVYQKREIEKVFPGAKSFISFVVRMNRGCL